MVFPVRARWIMSRRADLSCIVLSPLLSVVLVGLYLAVTRGGQVNVAQTARIFYYVFTVAFDHPHILQTFSRTHFDSVERKRHFVTHHWILGAALVGTFLWPEATGSYWFEAFFDSFGLWHIYAQNAGFLKVYGRLAPVSETDRKMERVFFFVLFNAYLFRVLCIDLSRTLDDFGTGGAELLEAMSVLKWTLLGGVVALAMGVVGRHWLAYRRGEFQWTARHLFLGALTASYLVNYRVVGFVPVSVMLVFDTLYHDVQYLRWMAHYQQAQAGGRRYAWKWGVGCLGLAFVVFYGQTLSAWVLGKALPISAVFLTVTLYHYYVDGIVWKFGTQPELQALLNKPADSRQADVVVEEPLRSEGKGRDGDFRRHG